MRLESNRDLDAQTRRLRIAKISPGQPQRLRMTCQPFGMKRFRLSWSEHSRSGCPEELYSPQFVGSVADVIVSGGQIHQFTQSAIARIETELELCIGNTNHLGRAHGGGEYARYCEKENSRGADE